MSGEIIAILAVGVALAGLIVSSARGLRQDMKQLEVRLEARIGKLESQIMDLHGRMAHLEGLLEGLREAISGRVKAS